MKTILSFIFLLGMAGISFGQIEIEVQDVLAKLHPTSDEKIIITYKIKSLIASQPYRVTIQVSTDGGKTFSTPLRYFEKQEDGYTGVGRVNAYDYSSSGYKHKTHQAIWDVVKEMGSLDSDRVVFKVRVTEDYIKTKDRELPRMVFVEGGLFKNFVDSKTGVKEDVEMKGFYISRYEITNADYALFQKKMFGFYKNYLKYLLDGENNTPTINTWDTFRGFCKQVNGRFPNLKEWVYAARGGQKTQGYAYSGSDRPQEVGHWKGREVSQVGTLKPNELGLYDMSGNIGEWLNYRLRDVLSPRTYYVGDVGNKKAGTISGKVNLSESYTSQKPDRSKGNGLIGLRLVKDIPKWRDKYSKVKKGKVTIINKIANITQDFSISETEITNEQYVKFLNFDFAWPNSYRLSKWIDLQRSRIYFDYKRLKYKVDKAYRKLPVTFVSHLGARVYAMWRGGQLPTEAQLALAKQQGKLNKQQVNVWSRDSYGEFFWRELENDTSDPVNDSEASQHVVRAKDGKREGKFKHLFYPSVGFRIVLLQQKK